MTKPANDRPTIPAPPHAQAAARNACRAAAEALGLPSQIERKRRAAQKRLLARQAEIEARRDTVPAPALAAAVVAQSDLHRSPETWPTTEDSDWSEACFKSWRRSATEDAAEI